MTATWTADDLPDGLQDDLGSAIAMAIGADDSDAAADYITDILNAIAPHLVADVRAARLADTDVVMEGWWHPNVKSGQVHDHPEDPGRGWSHASHRLCEPVYTHRETDRG